MALRPTIVALLAVLVFTAACSRSASDMSDAELRSALTDVLTQDDMFTDGEAGCVIDYLFDNTSRATLDRMADAETEAELQADDLDLLTDAVFSCL